LVFPRNCESCITINWLRAQLSSGWSTIENNDLQKIKLLDYVVHTKRIVGTNDSGVRSDNRTVSAMTDATGVAIQGSRFLSFFPASIESTMVPPAVFAEFSISFVTNVRTCYSCFRF
jgi:hypothetical protein